MPKDILEYVTKHIKLSPLYNPYTEGSFILKWAIYKHQRKKRAVIRGQRSMNERDEEYESRNVPKNRAPNPPLPASTPDFYRDLGGTKEFDHFIPKWEITLAELQELYDEARFERYLKWSYWMQSLGNQPNRRWSTWRKLCYSMSFKRRIPWLYPENGKLFF